ncbi:His-Xaa-Ser repeat protein HxsA2 [Nocardia tengchongensis]|uniref:His-Xaa-Ser repeat protein HxsA2 n=1 Tax=Nocardia tengchongensis TaxID=2055889 RepID=UPI003666F3C2
MRETPKILNLATALAALTIPAAALPIASAEDTTEANEAQSAAVADEGIQAAPAVSGRDDVELMSFTTHRTSTGALFAQHGSHSSHASHASHASSSPGVGGPYPPSPASPPPPVAPPADPPLPPPPAAPQDDPPPPPPAAPQDGPSTGSSMPQFAGIDTMSASPR